MDIPAPPPALSQPSPSPRPVAAESTPKPVEIEWERRSALAAEHANEIAIEGNRIARNQTWPSVAQTLLGLASVAFTGWAAWSAGRAAKASERSIDLVRTQTRPHITSKEASIVTFEVGDDPTARLVVLNSGGGPAFDLLALSALILRPPGHLVELPPAPDGPFGTITLGPGSLYELSPSRPSPVTEAEFNAVESKSLAIYVLAWVSYQDATGDTHLERIALESMFRADGLVFKAARAAGA